MLGGGEGKLCSNVLEVMENMKVTSRTRVERTFIKSLAREEEWSPNGLVLFHSLVKTGSPMAEKGLGF